MKRIVVLAGILALLSVQAVASTDSAQVAAHFPPLGHILHTPGAASNSFTPYPMVKGWLDKKSEERAFSVFSLGKTEQGRDIWAAHLGASGAGLRILIVARVHGNEPASSEAALEFIYALSHGELVATLSDVEYLVIPVANPDGSVLGQRLPPSGIDINRDYTLANQPETVMIAAAYRDFDPHVVVDMHEYTVWGRLGSAASAFDCYIAGINEPNMPVIFRELSDQYVDHVLNSLGESGLRASRYELLSMDGQQKLRVSESATTFVSAKNFLGMPGVLSYLVEVRGIGLGDQHYSRRTLAGYLTLRSLVQKAVADKENLVATLAAARSQILTAKTWELEREPILQSRTYPLVNSETGTIEQVEAQYVNRSQGKAVKQAQIPDAYLLPSSCRGIVARLRKMGVEVKRLKETVLTEVEVQTIESVSEAGNLYAGQKRQKVSASVRTDVRAFAKGDYIIPTRQRNKLYLQVLEVESPSGFAALGLVGDYPGVETPFYRLRGALPEGAY